MPLTIKFCLGISAMYFFLIYWEDGGIYLFWLSGVACGILVPWPGIEPGPPAVEVQNPNLWTHQEFPGLAF